MEVAKTHGPQFSVNSRGDLEDAIGKRVIGLRGVFEQEDGSSGLHGGWPFRTTLDGVKHVNKELVCISGKEVHVFGSPPIQSWC